MSEGGLTRRRALAAGAALAGMGALAGCTGGSGEEAAENVSTAVAEAPPTPPPGAVDNEYWDYIIRSLDWQNRQALAQTQGIKALLDDAGIEGGDDGG